MSTWLAIDVGTMVVGVALGNTLTLSARPLQSVQATPRERCFELIDKIIKDWQPLGIVVGLPLALDGTEQRLSLLARIFAADLAARTSAQIVLVDERSSTKQAQRIFQEKRAQGQAKRKHGEQVDAWAAAVILERHFASLESVSAAIAS
jgi:putative holliday junction resolvase